MKGVRRGMKGVRHGMAALALGAFLAAPASAQSSGILDRLGRSV